MVPERQLANLRQILEITRQMAATTDLDVLLGTIVAAACRVLECERATIFLFDAATNELYSRVATGGEAIRFPADRGIAGAAAQGRQIINVPDAYADPRFNPDVDRRTGFHTRNLLTFPLENLDGQLMGVLQALNNQGGPFDASDEEMARALAAQAGMALHRARLLDEIVVKQRMQRDLHIARTIQQALFPKQNPRIAGYEIAGWSQPADETGGDGYDFFPLPDGRLAVFVADATGHGIAAALVMAQFRSLLRAMLTVTDDLPRVATRVNALLAADMADGRFVTGFVGVLDPRQHALTYVSGGQAPLLFVAPGRDGRGEFDERDSTDVPFAVLPDREFREQQRVALAPGAMAVLLTDGFYEAADPAGELFSAPRVVEVLRRDLQAPLARLIQSLHAAVESFVAGGPQADDLTAVLIRRTP